MLPSLRVGVGPIALAVSQAGREAGGPSPRPNQESCSLALELEAVEVGRHGSHSLTESVSRARKRCAVAKCVLPRLASMLQSLCSLSWDHNIPKAGNHTLSL